MYDIEKIIFEEYGVKIKRVVDLSGGWMNEKFIVIDENDLKYVFKIFSSKKVEKMSNNEFGIDYLDNQMINNLYIENYMQSKSLNCPKILLSSMGRLMINIDKNRAVLMTFINGKTLSRSSISDVQLYNLGRECGYMHLLFKNVDNGVYSGKYLKLPTINELVNCYQQKANNCSNCFSLEYIDLLRRQKEIVELIKNTSIIDEITIGFAHGDFANDNILFDGNEPYIVDFELVRVNSYLQDIGRILMSYCFENGTLNSNKIKKFMAGYNTVSSLSEKDVLLSFITVWINEVDMWIKENYFNKEITSKAKRFQDELIYITYNFYGLITFYRMQSEKVLDGYKNVEMNSEVFKSKILKKVGENLSRIEKI